MKELLTRKGADLNRPYEKCLMYGASALTDAELIAVIIRSGSRQLSAPELAGEILKLPADGSGLPGICRLSPADFMTLPGIGEVKAVQLLCVGELSKRIAAGGARRTMHCTNPGDIAAYYMEQLRHEEQESILCMMLDTKMRFIGEERISTGTVNMSVMSTRELFLAAMRHRAVAIVLIHNHPSGDPSPSREDEELTGRVCAAGRLLDIPLIDHIIIGDRRYMSFLESGLLHTGDET